MHFWATTKPWRGKYARRLLKVPARWTSKSCLTPWTNNQVYTNTHVCKKKKRKIGSIHTWFTFCTAKDTGHRAVGQEQIFFLRKHKLTYTHTQRKVNFCIAQGKPQPGTHSTPELNFSEQKIGPKKCHTHARVENEEQKKREVAMKEHKVQQLRNQVFCQLCSYPSEGFGACKEISHTQQSPSPHPPKKCFQFQSLSWQTPESGFIQSCGCPQKHHLGRLGMCGYS